MDRGEVTDRATRDQRARPVVGGICDYHYDPESRCDGRYDEALRCDQCGRPSIFEDYDPDDATERSGL